MNKTVLWVVAVVTVLVLGVGGGLTAALVADDGDEPTTSAPTDGDETDTQDPEPDPSGDPSVAGPVPEGLEEYYGQQLDWSDCGGGTECATLTVPVDYEAPGDGDPLKLKLQRVPAADQAGRVGSVVVNPGGPGAPGTTMAENSSGYFRPQLLERVDIVAFDPRGTGASDPVDCLSDADLDAFVAQDPAPDDAAEGEALTEEQDAFFAGCVASSDDLVGHVSTVEAARDMDVLRAALGEEQLSYLGFSYGTTLGSTYASLFPANVGRFVLDGATDPTLDFRENALSQAAGFQTALNSYVDDCVAGGDCFLGADREAGLATITSLLDSIEASPLPTDDSTRDLQIGNAFYGLITPLYSRDNWSFLDEALQQALDGDGSTLLLLSDLYGSREGGTYTDNSLEAILAINCLDDPSFIEPDEVPAEFPAFEAASPTFGRVFAWGLVGCHGIQVEAAEPAPEIRAEGAAPIVVIGTTRDPATPYEEAVALAEQLASGVLLTRDGDGHTAYNKGNSCIDEAVEGYLVDGTVPSDGQRC
ncbi:alpha/beta hydrolase [Nocardioides litoris]|uniref:alpha/beta hydrolase n=1 Tax=Nocardioides litoris TaxID=1926648 RepID=UPI00111E7CC0|nr:alpha/beta hydrolase [Nocardioides litoris]